MMGAAATVRPRPAAFAPTPRNERRRRPPRPLRPMRARSSTGRTAPYPSALAKLIITTLAALLLLVGPLSSSAIGVGRAGALMRACTTPADGAKITIGDKALTGNRGAIG